MTRSNKANPKNLFRFYVAGFSGSCIGLDELRDRLINLRDNQSGLQGEEVKIWRNQGPLLTVFEHVGPVDKTIIL